MVLKRLSINNFRIIEHIDICLNPNINIFWGNNAQGKTSILESIFISGFSKSFKTNKISEVIQLNRSSSEINSRFENNKVEHDLEFNITKDEKIIFLNNKKVEKISNFFGLIKPVIFSTEEIQLFKGTPAGRRSLIDRAVLQANSTYLHDFNVFLRILKQRNYLLKNKIYSQEFNIWTEKYIEIAAVVKNKRAEYINNILPLFKKCYGEISKNNEVVSLIYPSFHSSLENLENDLRDNIQKIKNKEIQYCTTLIGPHRDVICFTLNDFDIKFASQGQQRSIALAFKIAQLLDLSISSGNLPVLLIDDISSELDMSRKDFLFRFLNSVNCQVFITTTDLSVFDKSSVSSSACFNIKNGNIS